MICFVILHYMVSEETISSINSILKNINANKKIIVVDNASPNKSGFEVENHFKNIDCVEVLYSKENLGFANGNNFGYRYAVKAYNPDFIVVMNNDVEIYQVDFYEKIVDIYKKEQFYVLGPDIYSSFSKVHQSPKRLKSYSYDEVLKLNKKFKFRCKSRIIIPIKCFLKEIKILKKFMQRLKFKSKGIDYDKKYYNIPLHGACFIFSKKFITARKDAFFSKTFMYFESEILDYECNRDNFKTIYYPDIKVKHHHSISSSVSKKSEIKRERFVNKCMLESLNEFIKLMNKDLDN